MTAGLSLRMTDVSAWYNRTQALFDVSLALKPGERVALLGRNGAGKTTTFLSLMGLQVRVAGQITFGEGARRKPRRTVDVARSGVAWVPDTRRIFNSLSVLDNLEVAVPSQRPRREALDEVFEFFPPLRDLVKRKGRELSGGEQQMLSIGRALVTEPSILLLDEPVQGLAPVMVEQLQSSLMNLSERGGLAILLAEQSLPFALSFCERVYVLDVGRIVYDGPTEDVRRDQDGWQDYLVGGSAVPPGVAQ